MATHADEMGPIGYLVVEFPDDQPRGKAFPMLVDLVDRGVIRILDLVFARKDTDGTLTVLQLADLDDDGELDLLIFEGAATGLLDDEDLTEAGSAIEPGRSAGILLYENRWAAPFVNALRESGAQLVAAGYIPLVDLAEAVDAAETTAS